MMGLGNARRSMKSPPLVLAALVACILVLGFNYWIASSRSVELQTRIVELEGRVRRAAAERGAVEMKKNEFQGELEKQREQIDRIQSHHSLQLENVNRLHQDEKAVLVNNITTSEQLIRDLQDQLKVLQKSYGKLQQDIFQFQRNQTSLEKKFAYNLSQCINQMKEVKEQCEEQLEEATRKRNEAVLSRDQSQQLQALSKPQPKLQEDLPQGQMLQGKGPVPSNKSQGQAPSSEVVRGWKPPEQKEETNEIQVVNEEELQRDGVGPPQAPGKEQAVVEDTLVDRSSFGRAGQPGQTTQVPVALLGIPENQDLENAEQDQLVIRGRQEEQDAAGDGRNQQKLDNDEYVDENEAESEKEKQAILAGNDKNVNVFNAEDEKKGILDLPDPHVKQIHALDRLDPVLPDRPEQESKQKTHE